MRRLFLLSPAKVNGERAKLLLNPNAQFGLARQFQRDGLPLAEVFTFSSGLYFRGKITYARHFADPATSDVVRVITTNRGLVEPELRVRRDELQAFGEVDIREDDPRYHEPIRRDAKQLAAQLGPDGIAILLGSIATAKYRDVLLDCFGERLCFPIDFVGRGDMSRGALLLNAAKANVELLYAPVHGAVLHGKRAPSIRTMKR